MTAERVSTTDDDIEVGGGRWKEGLAVTGRAPSAPCRVSPGRRCRIVRFRPLQSVLSPSLSCPPLKR